MALTREDYIAWRDEIIEQMQRLTKQPTVDGGGGIRSGSEQQMAVLDKQLAHVNRLIHACDGSKKIQLKGIDA